MASLVFGFEGVGGVAELLAAEVLAVVAGGEGLKGLGVDGSFLAFHFLAILEVLEHVEFALRDEFFVEKGLERVEYGGSWEGLNPSFGHSRGVLGFGFAEHEANGEDEEFVSVEPIL